MDEELMNAPEMDGDTGAAQADPGTAEPEDAGFEDMDFFGEDEDSGEAGAEDAEAESAQDNPEDVQEGLEGQEEAPQVVEVDGRKVPVQDLVQAASFGRQAAQEVLQLRQQVEIIDKFAQLGGMTRAEYMRMLEQQYEQARLQHVADKNNMSPEAAKEYLALQEEHARLEAQRRAEAQRQQRLAPYMELTRRYPELRDPAKIPPEVAAEIRNGANPVVAYQDWQLRQLQASKAVAGQKQQVKAKSPGSAANAGNGNVDDAFAVFDAVMRGDY